MSKWILIDAISAVFAMLALQIIARRFHHPKSEDKFIFQFWIGVPLLLFPAAYAAGLLGDVTVAEAIEAYLLFFAVAAGWIASYPAIYAASPTLVMAWMIDDRKNGITFDELASYLDVKSNSTDRIEDATQSGLIEIRDGKVQLTSGGKTLIKFFRIFRKILGIELNTV